MVFIMSSFSCGIVGLPNVGKSTLFNALLKKQVAQTANYPFCTVEPNIGVVEVPDKHLLKLSQVVDSPSVIPAAIEFIDIAGLVKGAAKGEGLGNQFLSHIREVNVIVHLVRLFENQDVSHVSDEIKPTHDMEIIESELQLADLNTLEKQDKNSIYKKIAYNLNQGVSVRDQTLNQDELDAIKNLNLLTQKPTIFVFNLHETQLKDKKVLSKLNSLVKDSSFLYLSAQLESELVNFSEKEQTELLAQYSLKKTGLNRLILTAYQTLGLISFYTTTNQKVRAWTLKRGSTAQQAAGVIHTDFAKNFIKADMISVDDFVKAKGWLKAREQGLVKTIGKDSIIPESQVLEFKFSA